LESLFMQSTAGIFLLILLPALPLTTSILTSWLLGGMIALGSTYGFDRWQAARADNTVRIHLLQPSPGNNNGRSEVVPARITGILQEITTSTDLIGDIAGATEAVMYQNEQAMRPIMAAVEQMAVGAAGQTQSTQETAQMAEELAVTTGGIAGGARAQAHLYQPRKSTEPACSGNR
jgi:hypothetical protein